VFLFSGRLLYLAGLSALLAEVAARVGCGLLGLWRRAGLSPLERFGVGLLLGWGAVGMTLLGLALTGLFFAPMVVGAVLALVLSSRATYTRGLLLARAATEARALGPVGLAVLGVGFAPALLFLMVPEFEIDCGIYHLGFPWQLLQAHRIVLSHVPGAFWVPLPVDLTFTIPLLLGDDRLAKWMVLMSFIAASAIFIAHCRRDGVMEAGWAGPLLALSAGPIFLLVTVSKNDIPAASLFVAGALLTRAGRWTLGAALLGLCVAAKMVYGPLVAIWFLLHPPPWRATLRLACLLLLPIAPWWIRTYLGTGNPVYPIGYAWIPSLDWGSENQAALLSLALWSKDSMILAKLPETWVRMMRSEHLPLLLVLPGMALLGRDRRAAWACAVGSIAVLGIGHVPRYMLPAIWLLSLLAVKELMRGPGLLRRAALGFVAVYALLRIGLSSEIRRPVWREAFAPLSATFERILTTRQEVIPALAGLQRSQTRAPLKVMSVGEWRTYRFPARLLYGGMRGETPLIQKLVKASHHPVELRKKFKQLGADILMYNFVSAEWLELRYYMFPWDKRSLRMYVEFLKRYLTPLVRPVNCDYGSGGFYVFRLLPQPLETPAADVWFVPGAESVFSRVTVLMNANRLQEALQEALAVKAFLPDVAHAWNVAGHIYLSLEDYPNGYKCLKRFGEAGVMDSMNLAEYGAVAIRVNQLELAERLLDDAFKRYRDHRPTIQINQSLLWATKASNLMAARRLKESERWLHKAQEVLDQIPVEGDQKHKESRRNTYAMLLWLQGEHALLRGDRRQAAEHFRAAYQTAPDSPLAQRWKDVADRLQPRMFGTP